MNNLISAARIVIVMGAIASFAVGCKQATAPADSVATTTAPSTESGATATSPASRSDTVAATRSANNGHATGSSHAGATDAGMGAADGGKDMKPGVKSNTGETQGTTPTTSLPVADGSR